MKSVDRSKLMTVVFIAMGEVFTPGNQGENQAGSGNHPGKQGVGLVAGGNCWKWQRCFFMKGTVEKGSLSEIVTGFPVGIQ